MALAIDATNQGHRSYKSYNLQDSENITGVTRSALHREKT
jgi:hypothetical protein